MNRPRQQTIRRAGLPALTLALALTAGLATQTAAAHIPPGVASAAEPDTATRWEGTLHLDRDSTVVGHVYDRHAWGTVDYDEIKPTEVIDPTTGEGYYHADAVAEFHERLTGECHEARDVLIASTDWSYSGPTTATSDDAGQPMSWAAGAAFKLVDDDAGHTYLTPHHVVLNGLQEFGCQSDPPVPPMYQANDIGSYHHGALVEPDDGEWLVDTDPDPSHLVGTTTFTAADPPGGSGDWGYAAYSFTATYDLTRTALPIVDAVDDGPTVVRYDHTANAPGRLYDVLINDIGPGLNITAPAADYGTAVAFSTGGADRGTISYAPPSDGFVGPVQVTYDAYAGNDPHTTARDSATWRLRFEKCRTHQIDAEGLDNARRVVSYLRGKLRVCTDGTTTTAVQIGSIGHGFTGHWWLSELVVAAINKAVGLATRGTVSFDRKKPKWDLSAAGASRLAGKYTTCDKWTFGPAFKFESKQKKEKLRKTLTRMLGEALANKLMRAMVSKDVTLDCTAYLKFSAGPVISDADGYTVPITVTNEWQATHHLGRLVVDGQAGDAYSQTRYYTLTCPYLRSVIDGSLLMPACTRAGPFSSPTG